MFSAAMCGRSSRWLTRSVIGPAPPVDQLISTGHRFLVSSMIAANVDFAHVGEPSSLRAWMCTIAAPASYARFASSAISTGVYGIAGQCFFVVTAPVRAQDKITLSASDTPGHYPALNTNGYVTSTEPALSGLGNRSLRTLSTMQVSRSG